MRKIITLTIVFLFLIIEIGFSQIKNEVIHDNVREFMFTSEVLQTDIKVFIWLPNDNSAYDKEYPVHYLIGGMDLFFYYGGVVNYLSLLSGIIPGAIVVRAIPNPFFSYENTDNADNYIDYLQYELIPYIDNSYRTNSFRSLWGHSNSAAFAFYSFLKEPDLFTAYFMSAPYGLNHFQQNDIERIDSNSNFAKYLYFSFGNDDNKEQLKQYTDFQDMIRSMQLEKLDFAFDLLDKENHRSIILRSIPGALQSFYSEWNFEIRDNEAFHLDSLKRHYDLLSEKYGYKINIDDRLFITSIGLQINNQHEKAIELLLYCIDLYPETKSLKFNLLAHSYLELGDIERAIFYYEKDLEINPDNEWVRNKLNELKSQ